MNGRKKFLEKLSGMAPSRIEQAIALLWYYEQAQIFTERSVKDLITDINEDGFGVQNTTRLREGLRSSRLTVKGSTPDSFRINTAKFQELSSKYYSLLNISEPAATSSVIPLEFVSGTRTYLEKLVRQINGSYDAGYFDASMVILRRLAETLVIEVYFHQKRQNEIKKGTVFMMLNDLVIYIAADAKVSKSRNFVKELTIIKDLGDTAAHGRHYVTPKQDVDDNRLAIRRAIKELLVLAGISK